MKRFIVCLCVLMLSGPAWAQSIFVGQQVINGATCPPVNPPSTSAAIYSCTGSGALYNWLGSIWNLVSTGTSDIAGMIAVNQIAVGSGVDTIGGSSAFTFESNALSVNGPAPSTIPFTDVTFDYVPTSFLGGTFTGNPTAAYVARPIVGFYGTLNPAIDDPQYNIYSGVQSTLVVPNAATKAIYTAAALVSDMEWAGQNGVSNGTSINGALITAGATAGLDTITGVRAESVANAVATNVYGVYSIPVLTNTTATLMSGVAAFGILSFGTVSTLTTYNAFMAYALSPNTSTVTTNRAFYTEAIGGIAANNYSFWSDETGVFKIRSDSTFDSVFQAIPSLHNPQFTKYTPGLANYEMCVPGCQWNGNVAEVGSASGGSGTLRHLRFIGQDVIPNPTGFFFLHQTVVTAAPAAGDCDGAGETNRVVYDSTNDNLYVCSGASGWRKIATAAP